ncbi:MAG: TetR/AcrR family transcriptional regulator [Sphingomonadales bacterium]|nr:TetR/AcrR family transcriptional regulator [Sphingomonadales bacterium]
MSAAPGGKGPGTIRDVARTRTDPGRAAVATRPPRLIRPADRRQQILAAAARLFAEHGFEASSVREIAAAVKILPGSLYHHFATKEDMLHAIVRDAVQRFTAQHEALEALAGDAEYRLVASVIARFRDFVDNWEVNAILWKDSALFRTREEFAYVQAAKTRSFKMQEKILVDGVRARLFRADLDVYLMIGTIARLINSAGDWFRSNVFFHSDRPDAYTLDRTVAFHVDCVLRLVRAPERIAEPIDPAWLAITG